MIGIILYNTKGSEECVKNETTTISGNNENNKTTTNVSNPTTLRTTQDPWNPVQN